MDEPLFHGDSVTSSRILYTPSSFAKTSLIHLQEIGSLTAQKPHTSSREHLNSYLFFTVCSGSGSLDYCGHSYSLKAGDCVFIDCRLPYSHHTDHDLWQLRWAHFQGPTMSNIYDKYTERGGRPCFRPENFPRYEQLMIELYQLAGSEDHVRDMKISEKLSGLLTLLMQESWNPDFASEGSPKRQNFLQVRSYLEEHFTEKITLDELSSRFYINKFYLTRIFKEQFGLSINAYLQQLRITRAKQLLRFTDQSIEAIGMECGIGDANYFARLFKKIEGISPGEFRKMW